MSSAEQQASDFKRTDLQQHDLGIPGREVVHNRVDISPEAPAFEHKHPGEGIIYVLEGSLGYQVEDKPPTTVKTGEAFSSRPKRSTRRGTSAAAMGWSSPRIPSKREAARHAGRVSAGRTQKETAMTQAETSTARTAVDPFRIDLPEEDLLELRRRIAATRRLDKRSEPRSGRFAR